MREEDKSAAETLENLVAGAGGVLKIWVRREGNLCGLAVLKERLRETAPEAFSRLREMGCRLEVMTGDRDEHAKTLLDGRGFDRILSGLSPIEKAEHVRQLGKEGRRVLFVGDGINDSAAMAEAPVSIAMGSGADVALASASGQLWKANLGAIADGMVACRRVLRVIRQNFQFALFYNIIGMALAATGLLHPVVAALLMVVSSLTVTWRALHFHEILQDADLRNVSSDRARWLPRFSLNWPAHFGFREFCALLLVCQGPLLAWFAGWNALAMGLATFVSGLVALSLLFWPKAWNATTPAGMGLGMVALGNPAMLLGWWVDADFGPVVRAGVCLCGCASSDMGWGLVGQYGWMHLGMVAASLPWLFLSGNQWSRNQAPAVRPFFHWLSGVAGMLVGMQIGGLLLAFLGVGRPDWHFILTDFSMLLGMLVGMYCGCALARRLEQWHLVRLQMQLPNVNETHREQAEVLAN